MNRAEFAFKLIDVLGRPLQNTVRLSDITVEKNIRYNIEYEDCLLDFYYQDKAVKKPVFVYMHGGGFVKGDKKYRRSFSEIIASLGYFVINMNYRLAPKHPFPALIEDAYAVLNKLSNLQTEYNLDLERIVLSGDSSGAYAASHLLATLTHPELHDILDLPDCAVRIAGFIGYCGPYDIIKMLQLPIPFGFVRKVGDSFLGMKLKRNFSNLKDFPYINFVSPIEYVTPAWPKTLLVYSKKDAFCYGQGERFSKVLAQYHVDFKEVSEKNILHNHCYHLHFWTQASKRAIQASMDFLREIMRCDPVPSTGMLYRSDVAKMRKDAAFAVQLAESAATKESELDTSNF